MNNKIINNDETYQLLEREFVTYKNLKSVIVKECSEAMIELSLYGINTCIYNTDVAVTSNNEIWVRKSVAAAIIQAQKHLNKIHPNYALQVFYGYRSPEIQNDSFEKIIQKLGYTKPLTDSQLEQVHYNVAVPDVAGHPTGGAIDVTIIDENGAPLDMGTAPHEFIKDSYTFSPFVPDMAKNNRQILRSSMLYAGFAPFDGEWWHFSYGDREWAFYWHKPHAIFDTIMLP